MESDAYKKLLTDAKKYSLDSALFNIVIKSKNPQSEQIESIDSEVIMSFSVDENLHIIRLSFIYYEKDRIVIKKNEKPESLECPHLPHANLNISRLEEWTMKNLENFDKIYDNSEIEIQYFSRDGLCYASDFFSNCRFKSMNDVHDYNGIHKKEKIIVFEYDRKSDFSSGNADLIPVNGRIPNIDRYTAEGLRKPLQK